MIKKLVMGGLIILWLGVFIWWTNPEIINSGTVKIWDRNNILLYESAGNVGIKNPIKYEQLPKYLVDAVVAAEDNTFWDNPGIDMPAMIRSAYLNTKSGKIVSGASTITQQLVRKDGNRVVKKIREILTALRLALSTDKRTVMTKYLNQTYFGHLAYGAQAAANVYFDKDVTQLSLAQSAMLAGIIASPDYFNPYVNFTFAKQRQGEVLDLMVKNKYITADQSQSAKSEVLTFANKIHQAKAGHFVDFVKNEMGRLNLETDKGINVYTTLDLADFELAQEIARATVTKLADEHNLSNAALVMLDNQTGAIRIMLGGINYEDATHSGQVNLTTSLRQPGSALKPVTYAEAFFEGYTPATLIYDVQTVYKTKKGEGFTPNNYDGKYHGMVLAREALASSLNLPAVEMLNRIGIEKFLHTAKSLGINTLAPNPKFDLALTLGGGEVTLLDLTNVYASLARGGKYIHPYAISKVTDDFGKGLYEHHVETSKEVWGNQSKQIAYLITDILSDPKSRIMGFGEKNPLVLSFPAAAKTGTTTDWHDNWTIGYTPDYTVGVWVGNNDNQAMMALTGITGAAPIWNKFFEEWGKDKTKKSFAKPERIVEKEICKIDGLLPGDDCLEKTMEIFMTGTEPKLTSKIYKKVKIDFRNGDLATDKCPPSFVYEKTFIDYPAVVYQWADQNHLTVIPRSYSPLCDGSVNATIVKSQLTIINPQPKSVFQTAPNKVKNEAMDMELNSSPDITSVSWYLDDKLLTTENAYPFDTTWKPIVGKHTIRAVGINATREKIPTDTVEFEVTEYGL